MRIRLWIVCMLLLISIVHAAPAPVPFTITAEPVTDKILEDGVAEFQITITNQQKHHDEFLLHALEDLRWNMQTVPVADRRVTIPAGESRTIRLLLKANKGIERDSYNIKLSARSLSDIVKDTYMRVSVGPHPSMFVPDFDVLANIPEKIDPRNAYSVDVKLVNNNILELDGIKITVKSNFIDEETVVDLGGDEVVRSSFIFKMSEDQQPTTDMVTVQVMYEGKSWLSKKQDVQIVEYLPPYKRNITTTDRFLKTKRVISLTNKGNAQKDKEVYLATTRLESWFTRADPKATTVTRDGELFHVWQISLDSDETTTVTVTTSYRSVLIAIIILLGLFALYHFYKAPLVITKSVKGNVDEAKVILHVRNRSNKPVYAIEIIERIPRVFVVKKGSFSHTLSPTKAYPHSKEGTVLHYELKMLEPKEERLIQYSMKGKMQVIGDVSLKPTVAKYKGAQGVEKVKSGSVLLSA